MRLQEVILRNFRSYRSETRIPIDENLTALIGRNEAGKSTVLDALDIFFNNDKLKIEPADVCAGSEDKTVQIGCVFADLPESLTIDATAETTLASEYLVRSDGAFEIRKVFNCALAKPSLSLVVTACHPLEEPFHNLLELKNADLKRLVKEHGVEAKHTSNVSMRAALWNVLSKKPTADVEVPLNKEGGKEILESLSKFFPIYALFRSDRASKDEDDEVQDPMKIAISEALKTVEKELNAIKQQVQTEACAVAKRTLEKLQEMAPDLANELRPRFKADPKMDGCFKLSLTSDDQIPINKRGSGVRRLILLNFFRAEAERKQLAASSCGVIYAIEEPETAQHPDNQRLIVEALQELGSQAGCQILLTTHVPGLAGLLSTESLRHIVRPKNGNREIRSGTAAVYKDIASDLGVLSEVRSVQLLICVEGPHDVPFVKKMSQLCMEHDPTLLDLATDTRVAFYPLGGSTLREFVTQHYLKELGIPEFHIYDRDEETPPKYQVSCDQVNAREDGSWAVLTEKRESENYLHSDAILEEYQLQINVTNSADIPTLVAEEVHSSDPCSNPWDQLPSEKKSKKVSAAKKRLNKQVLERMTYDRLCERDPDGEILGWMQAIQEKLQPNLAALSG